MSSDSPRPAPVAGVAEMAQDMASGPDVEAPPKGPPPGSPHHRTRYGLPRVLIIVVGLAAGVVVVAGLRAIPDIIGPVFLALVLTITVNPIRGWLTRHGASRGVASLAVFLTVLAIVVGLFAAAIVGIIQLATLMPQYADQIQTELSGIQTCLAGMGVTQADIQSMFNSIDPSQIASLAEGLLSSISGIFSFVLLMVVVLIFLAVDGAVFDERMLTFRKGREPVLEALGIFARGTRKYFGVATIFGGIVAVIDGVALVIMGIPAAGLWALLAFVTNYIPNVGFIIHHRPDPTRHHGVAGRWAWLGDRRDRRVLRGQLHHPIGAATEIRGRRGRSDHDRQFPVTGRLGIHPRPDRGHPGHPGQPAGQGTAGGHGSRRPVARTIPRRQAGVRQKTPPETAEQEPPRSGTTTGVLLRPGRIHRGRYLMTTRRRPGPGFEP